MKNFLIFFGAFWLMAQGNLAVAQGGLVINVKDYGAKGDGKFDNYVPLKKVYDAITAHHGGTIYFPAGNYYIGQYHDGKNKVADLQLKDCNGLLIYGSNAVISVKGNFHRSLSRQDKKKHQFSDMTAIIPFKISNCKNVTIKNLEIDGNVDQMTRDKGVMESGGHLLLISGSSNVNLEHLKIHHAQTDGVYITGNSSNIVAKNITSSNNARQGMSIIKLVNSQFYNCSFVNTGFTGGAYGAHAPRAGVDIEPHSAHSVSNILFENCLFENNKGSQFVVSHPNTTKDVTLRSSHFIANNNNSRYAIIVNAKNIIFENCTFDLNTRNIYPVWHKGGASSSFRNCSIRSSSSGMVAVNDNPQNHVIVDNCTFEYTGKVKIGSYFPYIRMGNMEFTNNTIKVPLQYYKAKGVNGIIQNARKVSGLKYISNKEVVKPQVSLQGSTIK